MSQTDFVTRGQALVSAGQYQEAVKVCRLGLLGRPTTVEGRVVLGQALLALKRYDEVLAEMRVALELDHGSIPAQLLKGEALLRKGDPHGALEVLYKVRAAAPSDPQLAALLAEAERLGGRPKPSAGHAALGAVSAAGKDPPNGENPFAAESRTKHYPNHGADEEDTSEEGAEDTGGSFTRPTALSTDGDPRARPGPARPPPQARPAPAAPAAAGDHSGTVEVDPESDGVELRGDHRDDDFGDVAQPPSSRDPRARRPGAGRGAGQPSGAAMSKQPADPGRAQQRKLARQRGEASSVELVDDDVIELEETLAPPAAAAPRRPAPGPGTAVRNAVNRPSGPISDPVPPSAAAPAALRATAHQPVPLPSPHAGAPYAAPYAPPHLAPPYAPPHAMPIAPPLGTPGAQPVPMPVPAPMAPPHAAGTPGLPPGMPPVMGAHGIAPALIQTVVAPGIAPVLGASPPVAPMAGMPPAAMPSAPLAPAAAPPRPVSMLAAQPPLPASVGRGAHVAALPPQAPVPMVSPNQLFPAASVAAAARPTVAISPHPHHQHQHQQHAAAVVDQLFDEQPPATPPPQGWARTMPGTGAPSSPPAVAPGSARHGADDPRAHPHDARLAARGVDPGGAGGAGGASGVPVPGDASGSGSRAPKTGMRKTRSRFQLALWLVVGAAMIGGGVFAGFQIRAMRLGKQITAARGEAVALATTDTWGGWVGARNRLASIAQASATVDNRAALARTRAIIAYEFGDGAAEAQAALDGLAGQGGLDAELAAAYLALARHDGKAAAAAADRALALAADDPAALYANSQAALLAGDLKLAIAIGQRALDKEARAMYAAGLARAYAAATQWDDGLAAADRALKATPEHPGALIARGVLLVEGGRVAPGSLAGNEIRAALEKIVREGTRPIAEQPRGVSPMQVALADLALARVDAARGNDEAANADMANALAVGLDDQRFAEEVGETLYANNRLGPARTAATRALASWPASLRARITLAQVALAQGNPAEALDTLAKIKDPAPYPRALAVRGLARLAAGDLDAARTDLDAALKRLPRLELALAGRAWIDVQAGELAEARARVEPLWKPGATSPLIATAYARVLRAAGDPASRDKARAVLERVVTSATTLDIARAHLEHGRLLRALGDLRGARTAYQEASRGALAEARLELGLVLLDDRDPAAGRKLIEQLVADAGERAPAGLLLEAARARMLTGDHAGAQALLERAGKLGGAAPWQLDRERGRHALRRGDNAGAAQALSRALDGCGDDIETFLLAAEVASADNKQAQLVDKLAGLIKARLKGRVEATILTAKLVLAEGRYEEADASYRAARDALGKQASTPRLQAQVEFGRAVVAYHQQDDMTAQDALRVAIALDPTIYAAYLFLADLVREKTPDKALELAHQAVTYNPDLVDGWVMYGVIAHRLRKRAEHAAAITRVNELAPGSEALRQLQGLR